MATRKWNAYNALAIMPRGSLSTTCFGSNRHDKRCNWDIDPSLFQELRNTLEDMEANHPSLALPRLPHLARLCLCPGYHQGQSYGIVETWEEAVGEVVNEYNCSDALKRNVRQLRETITAKDQTIEVLEATVDELQQEEARLQEEIDTNEEKFSHERDDLQSQLDSQRQQLGVLDVEIDEMRLDRERLDEKVKGLKDKLISNGKASKIVREELKTIKEALSTTKYELSTTKLVLETTHTDLKTSQRLNNELITRAEQTAKEHTSKMTNLTQQLRTLETELSQSQTEHSATKSALEKSQADLNASHETNRGYETTLRKNEEEHAAHIAALNTQVQALEEELSTRTHDLATAQRVLETAQTDLDDLRARVREKEDKERHAGGLITMITTLTPWRNVFLHTHLVKAFVNNAFGLGRNVMAAGRAWLWKMMRLVTRGGAGVENNELD